MATVTPTNRSSIRMSWLWKIVLHQILNNWSHAGPPRNANARKRCTSSNFHKEHSLLHPSPGSPLFLMFSTFISVHVHLHVYQKHLNVFRTYVVDVMKCQLKKNCWTPRLHFMKEMQSFMHKPLRSALRFTRFTCHMLPFISQWKSTTAEMVRNVNLKWKKK